MNNPKNIVIIILALMVLGTFLFMNNERSRDSKTIKDLKKSNKEYLERDSLRNIEFDAFQTLRDSIKQQRDTVFIFIAKTNENTNNEIARIDTTHIDSLILELSRRYGIPVRPSAANQGNE